MGMGVGTSIPIRAAPEAYLPAGAEDFALPACSLTSLDVDSFFTFIWAGFVSFITF
jgi:hypothetical protein